MDRVVTIRAGDRAVIKVDGVGVVYTIEAIPEPGGDVSTLVNDVVNSTVIDENTFYVEVT